MAAESKAQIHITDSGFQIGSVDFIASRLMNNEESIVSCVRAGDRERLKVFFSDNPWKQAPFSDSDIGLLRARSMEILALAKCAALEAGAGPSWCYYYYYSCVLRLQEAHLSDVCHQIVTDGILSFTDAAANSLEARTPGQYSPVIDACIRKINALLPGKISVDMVAEELHLSPKYLSALFCRETGQTMTDFIMGQRILEAQRLLRETDLSIAEIAGSLNFCSQSYFGSVFKKKTGMTPKEYKYIR